MTHRCGCCDEIIQLLSRSVERMTPQEKAKLRRAILAGAKIPAKPKRKRRNGR
jgi:hypothetical protein